jgi:hypothetical protein
VKNRVLSTDERCHLSPTGERVPFYLLADIQENLLNPDSYFRNGTTVNVLVPEFDPAAENKIQFFGLDSQLAQFDMPYIRGLGDDEIDAIIAEISAELEGTHVEPDGTKLVIPFDERITRSVSIAADVTTFDWDRLGRTAQFDVILMDPPWPIQGAHPTRGLDLTYALMEIDEIRAIPLRKVQKDGLLFMWVVTSMLECGMQMFARWGYRVVKLINWIKTTTRGVYGP